MWAGKRKSLQDKLEEIPLSDGTQIKIRVGIDFRKEGARIIAIVEDVDIGKLTPEAAYMLGKSVDNQRAECVFISCTNFRTAEIIEDLEQDIGKPVVSSNQATIWDALRKVGVRESVKGFGQLMTR